MEATMDTPLHGYAFHSKAVVVREIKLNLTLNFPLASMVGSQYKSLYFFRGGGEGCLSFLRIPQKFKKHIMPQK